MPPGRSAVRRGGEEPNGYAEGLCQFSFNLAMPKCPMQLGQEL